MIWKYSYLANSSFRGAPIPDPPYIDLEDEDEEELEEEQQDDLELKNHYEYAIFDGKGNKRSSFLYSKAQALALVSGFSNRYPDDCPFTVKQRLVMSWEEITDFEKLEEECEA